MIKDLKYNIKIFFIKINNVIRIIPVVWNTYDFDYSYAIDLFKFQLNNIANYLDSNKSYTSCAKINADKIRTVIRLMDKVYNEEYGLEFYEKISKSSKKEGWAPLRGKDLEFFKESLKKQDRAHKLLWELIEHNIQKWWD